MPASSGSRGHIDRTTARAILFDEAWYRGGGAPFIGNADEHFSTIGWRDGRNPHPLFDVQHYLRQAPQLLDGDVDPLTHYLDHGVDEGIDPHPLFDTKFYIKRNWRELEGQNPLAHYLVEGWIFCCDPSPFFDTEFYLDEYEDIAASDTNPLVHYALFGALELRRRPNASFDPKAWASRRNLRPGSHPLIDFTHQMTEMRAREHAPVDSPEVSVIILNLNKSQLTIECIYELMNDSDPLPREIVLVDNGSRNEHFERLVEWLPNAVRLIRLSTNRFFGEGNNIGAEAARGRLLLFLNNDAFVGQKTISTLAGVLRKYPEAGAVGPKFIYPDGRIQEAGAMISSCGTVTQRGKYLDDIPTRFAKTEPVDYVSAACVLVRREAFETIGGFDLAWDPAYYEDVDLCLKLEVLGKRTYYCPDAVVTHIENATSTDKSHGLRLSTVVQINREKFVSRWGDYIERGHDPAAVRVTFPEPLREPAHSSAGVAVLYTPYQLIPGGGERYLFSIAQWLSRRYRTIVITAERYSSLRLRGIALDLDLDLSEIRLEPISALTKYADCDVFVSMGNEIVPQVAPIGRRRLYVCQFPFPMHASHLARAWEQRDTYEDVIVYSRYAERYFLERSKHVLSRAPRVTILPPAVPMYSSAPEVFREPGRILSVGRFHPSGHCKRQDTLVEAFRELLERTGRTDLELHLAGTVSAEALSREFYLDVHELARGLPVYFYLNASPETIRELYANSSFYWHAAGFGQSELLYPERMEHFGISVVEAMSGGAIPFVYAAGGPAEIVADGETGFHWRTIDELLDRQMQALDLSDVQRESLRHRGHSAALGFDTVAFEDRLSRIVNRGSVDESSLPRFSYVDADIR